MSAIMEVFIKRIHNAIADDNDAVVLCCGAEGSGKTNLALLLSDLMDSRFDVEQVVFSGQQHSRVCQRFFRANDIGRVVMMDESTRAAMARRAPTKGNVDFVAEARENRKMRLIHLILYPWLMEVDKGIRDRRAHYMWMVTKRGEAKLYVARRRQFSKKGASWNYIGTVKQIPKVRSDLWAAYKQRVRSHLEARAKSKVAMHLEEHEENALPKIQLIRREVGLSSRLARIGRQEPPHQSTVEVPPSPAQ